MSVVDWLTAKSGMWSKAANWKGGKVPRKSDHAFIDAAGPSYLVTTQGPISIASIVENSTDATFEQSASSGAITLNYLTIDAGNAILDRANAIKSTGLRGGKLDDGAAGAVGALTIAGGTFLATANVDLNKALTVTGSATIGAAKGKTLTLSGKVNIATTSADTFTCGGSGIVECNTDAVTCSYGYGNFEIAKGCTFESGEETICYTDWLGRDVSTIVNGTLSLSNVPVVSLNNVSGGGKIIGGSNASAPDQLFIAGGDFAGSLTGYQTVNVFGTLTLTGSCSPTVKYVFGASTLFTDVLDISKMIVPANASNVVQVGVPTGASAIVDIGEGEASAIPDITGFPAGGATVDALTLDPDKASFKFTFDEATETTKVTVFAGTEFARFDLVGVTETDAMAHLAHTSDSTGGTLIYWK
jgi:hypothetical protein